MRESTQIILVVHKDALFAILFFPSNVKFKGTTFGRTVVNSISSFLCLLVFQKTCKMMIIVSPGLFVAMFFSLSVHVREVRGNRIETEELAGWPVGCLHATYTSGSAHQEPFALRRQPQVEHIHFSICHIVNMHRVTLTAAF